MQIAYRQNSQDGAILQEIILKNEYRLPEYFEDYDTIVDVGAHIGCFTMACLLRGAGKVYAFEPNPDNYTLLVRNVASRKGRVVLSRKPVWRSDKKEKLDLVVKDDARLTGMPHVRVGQSIEPVALDDILREAGSVRLLKLDCEGAEYPILHTSQELDRVQEIVGELHPLLAAGMTAFDIARKATRRLLEKHGFQVEIIPQPRAPEVIQLFFAKRVS